MEAVPHVQSYSLVKKWIKKKNLEEKFWHLRASLSSFVHEEHNEYETCMATLHQLLSFLQQ